MKAFIFAVVIVAATMTSAWFLAGSLAGHMQVVTVALQ